jgi:UDP-glucose 4-epimerase
MANVVVIGGNGFIGKEVCRLLRIKKRKIICVGRHPSTLQNTFNRQTYFNINESKLQDIIPKGAEVINLAYSTTPGVISTNLTTDLLANVTFNLDLLNACIEKQVKKLVIISSGGTVYGNHGDVIIEENHLQTPVSSYGVIKSTIEKYAFMYYKTLKLPVCVVRPSNAYGVNQSTVTGQGFIASAMEAMHKKEQIHIYGDGGTTRDYIHVTDVASGILSVLEHGITGEAYNLSTGVGTSNLEVINILKNYFKYTNEIIFTPKRMQDVDCNILNNKKLKIHTNWTPVITIKQGIEHIYQAIYNV